MVGINDEFTVALSRAFTKAFHGTSRLLLIIRLKLHFGLATDDSTPHSCFNPINFLIKKFNKVVRKSIKTQIIKVPLHPPVFWYSFGRAALEVGGAAWGA